MWSPAWAGLSSPGITTSTRLLPPMPTGVWITNRLPSLPTSEKHMLAVVLEEPVVRSVTVIALAHAGAAGKVPAGASTLMVPALAARDPGAEVVNSMV